MNYKIITRYFWFRLLITSLLILNGFWVISLYKLKGKVKTDSFLSTYAIMEKQHEIDKLKKQFITFQEISNLNKEFLLEDSTSMVSHISSDLVVLYYSSKSCGSCVLSLMQDLYILSKSIGKESILILTDSREASKLFWEEYYDFNCLTTIPANPVLMDTEFPMIFYHRYNGQIQNLYIPDLFPEFRQDYFHKVLPELYN